MGRSLVILLVVLAVLGGLFVSQQAADRPDPVGARSLVSVDAATVNRLEITQNGDTIVMERTDTGWRLTQPIVAPANSGMVDGVLGLLASLESDGVVSSNPDKAGLFQVGTEHGIGVALYRKDDGSPVARFTVGKLAQGFTHTYMTFEGSPDVHLVKGSIRFQLQKQVAAWRDRSILKFDPDGVSRLVFSGSQVLDLSRTENGWKPADTDTLVPEDVVRPILSYLSTLTALSFEDAPEELTGEPLLTISIWRDGQANPTDLVVEATAPIGYRVVTDADPQRYLIAKDKMKELVADPAAALGMGGAPGPDDGAKQADTES